MSMLRNLAVSLINSHNERIVTTLPKAKELRPFVERVITLSRKASNLEGDDTAPRALHLRRQAAGFFHAGNMTSALNGKRGQVRPERTAGMAALKRLFDELGERYKDRPGGYTRILKLGHRPGDNAELAIIELVGNQAELDAIEASKKRKSTTATGKKKKGGETKAASPAKTREAEPAKAAAKAEEPESIVEESTTETAAEPADESGSSEEK